MKTGERDQLITDREVRGRLRAGNKPYLERGRWEVGGVSRESRTGEPGE